MKKYIVYSVQKLNVPGIGEIENYKIYSKGNFLFCYFSSFFVQLFNPKKNILIK